MMINPLPLVLNSFIIIHAWDRAIMTHTIFTCTRDNFETEITLHRLDHSNIWMYKYTKHANLFLNTQYDVCIISVPVLVILFNIIDTRYNTIMTHTISAWTRSYFETKMMLHHLLHSNIWIHKYTKYSNSYPHTQYNVCIISVPVLVILFIIIDAWYKAIMTHTISICTSGYFET